MESPVSQDALLLVLEQFDGKALDRLRIASAFNERLKYNALAALRILTDVSGNRAKVKGLLTIHGVSREVVLEAEYLGAAKDPWGNQRYGFHAETRINRKDFGMTWNEVVEAGGVLVGDEVEILLDVEAVPAKS